MFDIQIERYVRKNFAIFVFFFFLTLINFWGSLHNPFIIDDSEHYLNPKKTNSSFLIYDLLPNQAFATNQGMQEYQNNWGYYRPIMHTVFRLQAELFKDNPVYYHLMCVVFFAWACFSIFQFLFYITKNELVALLGASLYLLHPFQGLCVNYKTAVLLSIQIILLNASFLTIVNVEKYKQEMGFLRYVGALLAFILALLIHELAFIFPCILLFYWVVFTDKRSKLFLFRCLGVILIAVIYFWLRSYYENFISSPHYKITLKEFLAAYTREIGWVIKRLILPNNIFLQSSTWLSKGMANSWIWIFYLYLFCFSVLMFIFYRRNRILFFLLGVFVSGFFLSIPPSKGILADGQVYFEPHWIFYTNIGLFGILGYLFYFLLNKYKKVGMLILVSYVLYLFHFSFYNNYLYSSSGDLFKKWSEDSPNLDLPRSVVCNEKLNQGFLDEAIACFLPLTQQLRSASAYISLGQAYALKKDYQNAKENFQKAKKGGMVGMALRSLSSLSEKEGNNEEAIKYLDEALQYDKFSLDLYISKANLFAKKKNWDQAALVLNQVRHIYPENENVKVAYIDLLFRMKDTKSAKLMAIQTIPKLSNIRSLIGLSIVLMINHEDDISKKAVEKAYQIDSKVAKRVFKNAFICPLMMKK